MTTHVAICIVGYRNAGDIANCLAALEQLHYHDFEVIICENGGTDSYVALVNAVGGVLSTGQPVTVIDAGANLGYAGGVNVGMRATPHADAWWIVNPDTQPAPDSLTALISRLAEGDCDAAGGTLCHPGGVVQAYGGRWHQWLGRAESIGHGSPVNKLPAREDVEPHINYILGASMIVNRRFVEVVGLMREDYFLYCEEVEWGLRARSLNLRLGWAPGAFVSHGQGGTTGSAAPIHERPRLPIYLDERNKVHVTRDTMPSRLPVAIIAGFILLTLRYGRRSAWAQWRHAFDGWRAGVKGERGIPAWLIAKVRA